MAAEGTITLHIGPATSDVVSDWVANRSRLLEAARDQARFAAHVEVIDLLEVFLDLWRSAASRSATFEWSYQIQPDVLLLVGRCWLDLGQLTASERDAMGAPLASAESEAFTEVVVRGMAAALREAGPEGHELLARLAPDE